jgi:hypothetical protein
LVSISSLILSLLLLPILFLLLFSVADVTPVGVARIVVDFVTAVAVAVFVVTVVTAVAVAAVGASVVLLLF